MAYGMDLRELLEAQRGLPNEDQAARKIATFAVIPAAMAGLLAGARLVGLADPLGRLVLVCVATASGAGFGIAFLVLGVYRLFGFRPVAILADALAGGFMGLLCGAVVTLLFMWSNLVPVRHSLWPLVLIPVAAVSVPLYRAWSEARSGADSAGESEGPQSTVSDSAADRESTEARL